MRVLIVTKLFPNAREPAASPFNRQQFAALARLCDVEVLASIPWFPGARHLGRWSAAGRLVAVPAQETIDELEVRHPRFLYLPRVPGHAFDGALYAASLLPHLLRRRGRFDVILGSWAYPDGAAVVALARMLRVPSVVKLHGTDINVVARQPVPRLQLRWALPRADRVLAVSAPLAEAARRLGVPSARLEVLANGVDRDLFCPRDRAEARRALGYAGDTRRWAVCVGRLELTKGVLDLLEAFGRLAGDRDDVRLVMVGDGRARAACQAAAAPLGDRVVLAPACPLAEVSRWMAAADAVVMPSWNEGTPNVLLEALASGRRVVATSVGGVPDIVTSDELGELVPPHAPAALVLALERALARPYEPARVAIIGRREDWSQSARRLYQALARVVAPRSAS